MCSALHVSAIVNVANWPKVGARLLTSGDWPTDQDATFQKLCDENVRSLVARYGELHQDADEGMSWIPARRPLPDRSIIEALKLIDCYRYQSCEHEGWEGSEAEKWTRGLYTRLVSLLPGWNDAPWSLP
jgi:hypothetical protein